MNPVAGPLEELELPGMSVRDLFGHFGPGIVLMMTGIGTSHLVTLPTAGGRFAFALLWCIPVAYVFKYYSFEMAFRFTNATGKSLMEAYGTAWKKWPVWYMLVVTILQSAIGQAGRLIAAAAVLYYFFTGSLGLGISLELYSIFLGTVSVITILRGNYRIVEVVAKVLAAALVLSTIIVYLVKPAPLSSYTHFFLLETPPGSWLLIAALLGLLPTGIDVSLQASEWGKAKRIGLGGIRGQLEEAGLVRRFDPFCSAPEDLTVDTAGLSPHLREYSRRWFLTGLWDFRLGHLISFVMAVLFLLLAAVWLHPHPVEGQAVMGEIAKIFTRSVGPWMAIVFTISAFAATFSTAFNYFDGWPRIVAACCRNLFRSTAGLSGIAPEEQTPESRRRWYSEYNIYRLTMLWSLLASVTIIAGIPQPVYLVLVASALAFFISPVIFFLNLYFCLTVIPKTDRMFYPSRFARWFSGLSLFVVTGLSTILILARIFNIALFGA